jgi:transketolase
VTVRAVAAVIVNYNAREAVLDCISSLRAEGLETVVVVDNDSATYGWPGGIERRFELERWSTDIVSGRDHEALERALTRDHRGFPHVVVAHVP